MKLNKQKCCIFTDKISWLGFTVSKDGVEPDKPKLKVIEHLNEPKSIDELRSFLGLMNYDGPFIKNFSNVSNCLYNLLKRERCFRFGNKEKTVFNNLKYLLNNAKILALFSANGGKIRVICDASDNSFGACLEQQQETKEF